VGGRKSLGGGDGSFGSEDGSRLLKERSGLRVIWRQVTDTVPTGASKHATAWSAESRGLESKSAKKWVGLIHTWNTLLVFDEHELKHFQWKRPKHLMHNTELPGTLEIDRKQAA